MKNSKVQPSPVQKKFNIELKKPVKYNITLKKELAPSKRIGPINPYTIG